MKLTTIATAVFVTGCATVQANGDSKPTVAVYVVNEVLVPVNIRISGEALATKMFAEVGVHLVWRHRQPEAGQAQRE